MADSNDPNDLSGLDAALAQAKGEIDAMQTEASFADELTEIDSNFTMHEVEGVGRYVIADDDSYYMLSALVADEALALGFSPSNYPVFDALISDRYGELNPELNENLAAVRNTILLNYFAETPEGISTEKAIQAVTQIAMFVGNGLVRGSKAELEKRSATGNIDPEIASAGFGIGARYIYEKILEAQRQSDWLRPFAPITALFGGKPLIDWKLPELNETPFREEENIRALQMAEDLDALGEHLLETAARMQDVQNLSESVRQDAIEIAKEILRKLKLKMGQTEVLDGINLDPDAETDELGGLAGVAMIFELLLAWGRGIDASLMQHPTVQAAIRAVGQLGYIAKMESMRLAGLAGKQSMVDRLQAQMKRMPKNYTLPINTRFGDLIDRVHQGIDTVLNRTVEINGPNALVGHTPSKQLGGYMSATPIAGLSMLGSSTGASRNSAGKENAAIQQAIDTAERAQAARIQSQIAQRGGQQQARTSGTGRQALQQAKAAQQRQQASRTSNIYSTEQLPPGIQNQITQRAIAMRASMRSIYSHDEDDMHHNPTQAVVSKLDPRILQSLRASMAMKGAVNPGQLMNSGAMRPGVQTYGLRPLPTPNLKQNPPAPPQQQQPVTEAQPQQQQPVQRQTNTPTPPPKPSNQPLTEEERRNQPLPPPPTNKPTGGGGGGRGF